MRSGARIGVKSELAGTGLDDTGLDDTGIDDTGIDGPDRGGDRPKAAVSMCRRESGNDKPTRGSGQVATVSKQLVQTVHSTPGAICLPDDNVEYGSIVC